MAATVDVRSRGRHALVLAAGAGRRFGGAKLLARWGDGPLICAALRTALLASVEGVMVVLGAEADAVANALDVFDDPRLRLVHAYEWEQGLSASLRTGVAALPAEAEAVVIFLGDMPAVPAALADLLLDAVAAGAPAAVVISDLGPAHPVAFAASQFEALCALTGDQGARRLLSALGPRVATVRSADPGVVFDVDHPDDLASPA